MNTLTAENEKAASAKGGGEQKTQENYSTGLALVQVPISKIIVDAGTQSRISLEKSVVAEYAKAMAEGAVFPPLSAVKHEDSYYLTDGFHRLEAKKQNGEISVDCTVEEGTIADARWKALSMNATHGLRRTNADKKHAVKIAIEMRPELSDRAIAEHCAVSNTYVSNLRAELSTNDSSKRIGLDGKARSLPKKEKADPLKEAKEVLNIKNRHKSANVVPLNGLEYATMSIGQLQKIDRNDGQRDKGFDKVIKWIEDNRGQRVKKPQGAMELAIEAINIMKKIWINDPKRDMAIEDIFQFVKTMKRGIR